MSRPKSSNTSKETPKPSTAKTASAPSFFARQYHPFIYFSVGFGVMVLFIYIGAWLLKTPAEERVTLGFNCVKTEPTEQETAVIPSEPAGETCETGEFLKADTPETRTQGLSGRASSADTPGMVFVFDDDQPHEIWMKDMQFPLHLIWLDSDFKVVDIAYDVAPETYPKTFTSAKPARYLIELDTSFASKDELPFKIGDQVYY